MAEADRIQEHLREVQLSHACALSWNAIIEQRQVYWSNNPDWKFWSIRNDEADVIIHIFYCPFCGEKLPN